MCNMTGSVLYGNTEERLCNHCCSKRAHSLSVCVCVHACNFKYSLFNEHARYCFLWPVLPYIIFPCYLINGTIFENKFLDIKWVLWFSLQLLSEEFLIIRITERDMIKNAYWFSCKLLVTLFRFNEILIFSAYFQKIFSTKFHQNPSSGSGVPCGLTGRHTNGQRWGGI